jgi:WW domain-containing oxidoreductase
VNNAGVFLGPFQLSEDGIELQFATNHVGHFLLTRRLLDLLVASQPSRIVVVSSSAHGMAYTDGISFEKISDESHYSKWYAYGQSKLANILFSNQLASLLKDKNVFCNSLHPGVISTNIQGDSVPASKSGQAVYDGRR